jgi:hypothetical protein
MPPLALRALELALLTLAYAGVDFAVRRQGLRIPRLLPLAACALLAPFWSWEILPGGNSVRIFAAALTATVAWPALTRDRDLLSGERLGLWRALLAIALAGIFFSPAALCAALFLLTAPFGQWQHHSTLPMRLLQAAAAWAALASTTTFAFGDTATLVFFVLTITISHYFITALAKVWLGPRWHSWATGNRLSDLAAGAWAWGWARFLPWPAWLRVIRAVRPVERPLQAAAFALELAAPLALLHPHAAVGFCLAWAGFHVGVVALSGLFFWEWILADLALAALVLSLGDSAAAAFGAWPVAASLAFMAVFPLRHKLWKPMPLGWFDTPLTQRMHWRVTGESGREYGLYNDFMCPHERLYGKVHGCFLAPAPVLTYHLGEAWKPALRDALVAAGPDRAKLDAVRERFGVSAACPERAAHHRECLERFLSEVNRGARKHALPRGLRWLKAPGDQLFYWGDLPAFRGQERAARARVVYREEYFDGAALRRLREETVMDFEVRDLPPGGPLREPTPKELDDFLLSRAAGRLIDLPGFGGGFKGGDDGKPRSR